MPKTDPMTDILGNHTEYPDPVSQMAARALVAFNEDDMEGYRAVLDCIRVVTCARTRAEAIDIVDDKGRPWSMRTKRSKRSKSA